MNVRIGNRVLGDGNPPFVVAEAGINHNGSVEAAISMVHTAKEAGCDAVKFATLKAAEFCNPEHLISYRYLGEVITEPEIEMFRRSELPDYAWRRLAKECEKVGILFFSTPQNESDLKLLLEVGVPAIKVGSDDLTNLALLEAYSSHGLPVILSTGMADPWDIRLAGHIVAGRAPLVVCVCTSEYPCPPEHANVARIGTLREVMPGVPIGFSDHTRGSHAAIVAAAFGACYYEKHFTLDNEAKGPDHEFSANPEQLSEWVAAIRSARRYVGDGVIRPTEVELQQRDKWRRKSGQQIRGTA